MAEKNIPYQALLNIVRSMEGDELFYFFLRACENCDLQIGQICLDGGADINIRESDHEKTLLITLVESGKFTPVVGDWFIKNGADINITGCGGFSNLTVACYKGDFDTAKYFIDKGIKIKKYNIHNFTTDLYYAVRGKNYEIVKMLLELDIDFKSEVESFFSAIESKQSKVVELFLQKGMSPNFHNRIKEPIHITAENKDIQTANILLQYNADVNAKGAIFINDDFVLTSMDIAVLNQDIEMQKLFSAFGGTVSSKEEKLQALTECSDNEKAFLAMKKILAS